MSRKSVAALAIVPIAVDNRLPPTEGLTDKQAQLWRDIVDSKPGNWFDAASAPVLAEYVRAVTNADRVAAEVEAAMSKGFRPDYLRPMLDMQEKAARLVSSLAVKLRLTPQSRYTPQAAATADRKAAGKRPWQSA